MKKALIAGLLAATIALPAFTGTDGFTVSAEQKRIEKISAEEEKSLCEGACFAECYGCSVPVEYLGEFTAHAYCGCYECNGEWTGEPTFTGTDYEQGRTVAVDPSVIPLGSKIAVEYADGSIQEFVAEDTGSGIKGNIIDVYFESHADAQEFGHKEVKIYLEVENE